uniref:Uncharacterized protein n=1 Tax=Anopheles minimus TaxID=112268 RepID=A0A182WNR1_9DIPT
MKLHNTQCLSDDFPQIRVFSAQRHHPRKIIGHIKPTHGTDAYGTKVFFFIASAIAR